MIVKICSLQLIIFIESMASINCSAVTGMTNFPFPSDNTPSSIVEPSPTVSILFTTMQLSVLVVFKIIGGISTSILIDARHQAKTKIFHSMIWLSTQYGISRIHGINCSLSGSLLGVAICLSMVISERIRSEKKLVCFLVMVEVCWLWSCNDISCIAAYILVFEGCFVQRIKEEYSECKLQWTDRHLLCFAVCKLLFISWIAVSLNWVLSVAESLYFVIPVLSLRHNKGRLNHDQWFFVDGCSHISLFCFWWFSSNALNVEQLEHSLLNTMNC